MAQEQIALSTENARGAAHSDVQGAEPHPVESNLKELLLPETKKKMLAVIHRTARNSIGREDAEDILQDALVRAHQKIKAGKYDKSKASVATFACLIARNVCSDFFRSKNRRLRRGVEPSIEDFDLSGDLGDLETRQRYGDALVLIGKMPKEMRRKALLMLEGKKPEEIASELGISVKSVYSALNKIRAWSSEEKNTGDT